MPLLQINTNISIDDSTAFAKDASRIVAGMLGKPESYVMVMVSEKMRNGRRIDIIKSICIY